MTNNLKYIQGHIWVRIEKEDAIVGVTDFAIERYGNFLYSELPEIGDEVEQLQEIGSLETSKEVFTIQSPLSGEIVDVNEEINDANMDILNESPYDEGWLFKIKFTDEEEIDTLLTSEEYDNYVESITYEEPEEDDIL